MPCDIGYKSIDVIVVVTPQPTLVQKRVKPPEVDDELMARIGQTDPAFVGWMDTLDQRPLWQQALDLAIAAVQPPKNIAFKVAPAGLSAKASVVGDAAKRRSLKDIDRLARRWQVEVLAMVLQLLGFATQISAKATAKGDVLKLECEKQGDHQVTEYVRVTFDPEKGASMLFEHFASETELDATKDKLRALAQKLGVRIDVTSSRKRGSPIPEGVVHRHHLKHRH